MKKLFLVHSQAIHTDWNVVGGGGGHEINVDSWTCKIFYQDWLGYNESNSYRMSDPKGDVGLYMGPVNEQGVPNGRGRLEYDNGITFIGEFSNGVMQEGTNDRGNSAIHTMQNGRWPPGSYGEDAEEYLVARYPFDATVKSHEYRS